MAGTANDFKVGDKVRIAQKTSPAGQPDHYVGVEGTIGSIAGDVVGVNVAGKPCRFFKRNQLTPVNP
jgi:ribosomal protein L21E